MILGPGIQMLLQDAQAGQFDMVLTPGPERRELYATLHGELQHDPRMDGTPSR